MTGIPPFFDCFYVFMVRLLIGKYTVLSDSLIKRGDPRCADRGAPLAEMEELKMLNPPIREAV